MWTSWWTAPFIAISVSMTMGCAASGQPSEARAPLDASLTAPCDPLPLLAETDGRAALRWMIGAAEQFNDCAGKHRRLVEAVR
jgi:hypothetical protein